MPPSPASGTPGRRTWRRRSAGRAPVRRGVSAPPARRPRPHPHPRRHRHRRPPRSRPPPRRRCPRAREESPGIHALRRSARARRPVDCRPPRRGGPVRRGDRVWSCAVPRRDPVGVLFLFAVRPQAVSEPGCSSARPPQGRRTGSRADRDGDVHAGSSGAAGRVAVGQLADEGHDRALVQQGCARGHQSAAAPPSTVKNYARTYVSPAPLARCP